jgi:hypothetical protein
VFEEKASADHRAAEAYLDEFSQISKEGLRAENIYNANKTFLY